MSSLPSLTINGNPNSIRKIAKNTDNIIPYRTASETLESKSIQNEETKMSAKTFDFSSAEKDSQRLLEKKKEKTDLFVNFKKKMDAKLLP